MRRCLAVIVLVVSAFSSAPASAAISFAHMTVGGASLLLVQGMFEANDDPKLLATEIAATAPEFLAFNSSGGDPVVAMNYGRLIRGLGVTTLQVRGSQCMSSCLLAFMGGKFRYAEDDVVAVDNASFNGGAQGAADGVKTYLVDMGITGDFLDFVHNIPAGAQRTLSLFDLAGYQVVTGQPTVYQPPTSEELAVSNEQPSADANAAAVQFFQELQRAWSASGNEAASSIQNSYADNVAYYGAQRSRADVISEKQQFLTRWPTRIYMPRPGSTGAACFDVCSVFGIVDWYTFSAERRKMASGTVNMGLSWDPRSHKVIAETGKIMATDKSPIGPDRMVRRWIVDGTNCALGNGSGAQQESCESQALLASEIVAAGWCRQVDATWKACDVNH